MMPIPIQDGEMAPPPPKSTPPKTEIGKEHYPGEHAPRPGTPPPPWLVEHYPGEHAPRPGTPPPPWLVETPPPKPVPTGGGGQWYVGEEVKQLEAYREYLRMKEYLTRFLSGKSPGIYPITGTDYYAVVLADGTVKIVKKDQLGTALESGISWETALGWGLITPEQYLTHKQQVAYTFRLQYAKLTQFETLWGAGKYEEALGLGLQWGLISETEYKYYLQDILRYGQLSGIFASINELSRSIYGVELKAYELGLGIAEFRTEILKKGFEIEALKQGWKVTGWTEKPLIFYSGRALGLEYVPKVEQYLGAPAGKPVYPSFTEMLEQHITEFRESLPSGPASEFAKGLLWAGGDIATGFIKPMDVMVQSIGRTFGVEQFAWVKPPPALLQTAVMGPRLGGLYGRGMIFQPYPTQAETEYWKELQAHPFGLIGELAFIYLEARAIEWAGRKVWGGAERLGRWAAETELGKKYVKMVEGPIFKPEAPALYKGGWSAEARGLGWKRIIPEYPETGWGRGKPIETIRVVFRGEGESLFAPIGKTEAGELAKQVMPIKEVTTKDVFKPLHIKGMPTTPFKTTLMRAIEKAKFGPLGGLSTVQIEEMKVPFEISYTRSWWQRILPEAPTRLTRTYGTLMPLTLTVGEQPPPLIGLLSSLLLKPELKPSELTQLQAPVLSLQQITLQSPMFIQEMMLMQKLKLNLVQLQQLRAIQIQGLGLKQITGQLQVQVQLQKQIQALKQIQIQIPKIPTPTMPPPTWPPTWPPPIIPPISFKWPPWLGLPKKGGFWGGWFKREHPIKTWQQMLKSFGLTTTRIRRGKVSRTFKPSETTRVPKLEQMLHPFGLTYTRRMKSRVSKRSPRISYSNMPKLSEMLRPFWGSTRREKRAKISYSLPRWEEMMRVQIPPAGMFSQPKRRLQRRGRRRR